MLSWVSPAIFPRLFIVVCLLAGCYRGPAHVPQIIRQLARPEALRGFSENSQRDAYIEGFSDGYLSALTSPGGQVTRFGQPNDPAVAGFAAGRETALAGDNGNVPRASLADYGYVLQRVEGFIYVGFEQRDFRPKDRSEIWWVASSPALEPHYETLRKFRREARSQLDGSQSTTPADLTAYVSPPRSGRVLKSGYGHLGTYDREMVVVEVHRLGR